jgi:UMF1 family MFS transporter
MYDWANSAYATLLITVVLHYLQAIVLRGPTAYALGIAAAMFLSAVLSPLVGAAADANRSKHRWLTGTALCGSAAAAAMALAPSSQPWLVLTAFVLMGVCFELSLVPYNGLLVEITDATTINRVSAWGFAAGYFGGSLPLVVAWGVFHYGERIGLSDFAEQHRACILLMGLWWAVFSLPAIFILRDNGEPPQRRVSLPRTARNAVLQVVRTLAHIRRFPILALFLLAFLLYNDGVQTVITQSMTLAKEMQFSIEEMILLVLAIQLIALPGSLLIGWLSDRWGQKPTLLACLAVWLALLVDAALVMGMLQGTAGGKAAFALLGFVLALVMGGTQSVSRALMGVLSPPRHAAEFFGFFNLSGKAASVLGPVTFIAAYKLSGNNVIWAAAALLPFFAVGIALLAWLDVAKGRRQAVESADGTSCPQ